MKRKGANSTMIKRSLRREKRKSLRRISILSTPKRSLRNHPAEHAKLEIINKDRAMLDRTLSEARCRRTALTNLSPPEIRAPLSTQKAGRTTNLRWLLSSAPSNPTLSRATTWRKQRGNPLSNTHPRLHSRKPTAT